MLTVCVYSMKDQPDTTNDTGVTGNLEGGSEESI